jgi:hypothetical protein
VTDTVERMVWMDTIEPGTVLLWDFMGEHPEVHISEWVTVLAARLVGGQVHAIVARVDGRQDAISRAAHTAVRIQVSVAPENAS